jgi:hypothetical protein
MTAALSSNFTMMASNPTPGPHAGPDFTQIQHIPVTDQWYVSVLRFGSNGWVNRPFDAAAGVALQQRAEAYVAAHPKSDYAKFGAPTLAITTDDGAFIYRAATGEPRALYQSVLAAADAPAASPARPASHGRVVRYE